MNTDKRRAQHSLQKFVVARNCDREVDMSKGNVANRVFQSIFHRSLCRSMSHHVHRTNPTATTGRNTTSQSTDIKDLYHEQCRNNMIESCSPSQKVENSRYCNPTTIAFGLDNGDMNHDSLYVSPVTYKRKFLIKGWVRIDSLTATTFLTFNVAQEVFFCHLRALLKHTLIRC